MKEQEIIEGNRLIAKLNNSNKLIAEFMGFSENSSCGVLVLYNEKTLQVLELDKLSYHSSWDWLMPVVEKIESLKGVSIYIGKNRMNIQHSVEISYESNTWTKHPSVDKTIFIQNINKKEATWIAVVEFIKWYNAESNKKEKN